MSAPPVRARPTGRWRAWLGVVVGLAAGCGGPDTLVPGDVAIMDVTVLPMTADGATPTVLEEQAVIIADGRIAAIGSVDEIGPEEDVEIIDGDGLFLIPGLTEMHGHLPSPRLSDIDIKNLLFLYLANGVTTVRGMQGNPSQFDLRAQIDRGLLLGPRLYLGSVAMSGGSVTTPEEAEQRVREYKVRGYDLLKIHEGLEPEVYDALARTAREVDIAFGGHVPDAVGLRSALSAGQSSIDHLDNYLEALVPDDQRPEEAPGLTGVGALLELIDESAMDDLVAATVAADAWVVPTMVLWETAFFTDRPAADRVEERPEVRYMPPEAISAWSQAVDDRLAASDPAANRRVAELRRRMLQALHRGGANIALGTDSPQIFSVPGFAMHHEMGLYVELGMSPYEVLEIATRRPAEYFGLTDEFGTVSVGRRADLILLTEDPLEDLGHLQERAGVMVRGRWIPEEEIQRRLEEMSLFYGH